MNKLLERNLAWLAKQGINVSQNRDDLEQLYAYMLERDPVDVFAEIGVWQGGTLLLFGQFVREGGTIIGIDKYDSPKRRDGRNRQLAMSVADRLRKIRNIKVHIVQKYSVDALPDVKQILAGREIDYLHIDGDHTFKGAKTDFDSYLPLMQPDGLVQIHDIYTSNEVMGKQPTKVDARGFVRDYWQQVKQEFNHIEFANRTENPNVTGIGIIQLKPEEEATVVDMAEEEIQSAEKIDEVTNDTSGTDQLAEEE